MKYKIKITYDTGDSFKTERGLEEFIEGSWQNLDIVTENLNRIKEHYEYYELCTGYNFGKSEKEVGRLIKEYENKEWYAGHANDCVYSLKLLLDDGTEYTVSAYQWCGYFESLVGAEIVQELPKFTLR